MARLGVLRGQELPLCRHACPSFSYVACVGSLAQQCWPTCLATAAAFVAGHCQSFTYEGSLVSPRSSSLQGILSICNPQTGHWLIRAEDPRGEAHLAAASTPYRSTFWEGSLRRRAKVGATQGQGRAKCPQGKALGKAEGAAEAMVRALCCLGICRIPPPTSQTCR